MYPRNAASPERIPIGAVVQISDGAVQTSGVSVVVQPQGGSEAAGGGTVAYSAVSGVVQYTPTQAETDYTSFIVTAYRTGCIPVSQVVVTTASATPGRVVVSGTKTTLDALNDLAAGAEMDLVNAPNATAVTAIQSGLATPTNITAGTITTVTNLTNAPTAGDLTAAMKASVKAEADTALTDYDGPTNAEMVARTLAAADYFDPATDTVARVTLVDTTTTNTDMVAAAPSAADVKTAIEAAGSHLALILADTSTDGVVVAAASKTGYTLTETTGLGNQTADITGSLSGSVGSVTGAVGSVTGNVGGSVGSVTGAVGSVTGNVGGSVASVTAAVTLANGAHGGAAATIVLSDYSNFQGEAGSLTAAAVAAEMFAAGAGTYAAAGAGSVVKEIVDNAGGSTLTVGAIADEVETRTLDANVTQWLGTALLGSTFAADVQAAVNDRFTALDLSQTSQFAASYDKSLGFDGVADMVVVGGTWSAGVTAILIGHSLACLAGYELATIVGTFDGTTYTPGEGAAEWIASLDINRNGLLVDGEVVVRITDQKGLTNDITIDPRIGSRYCHSTPMADGSVSSLEIGTATRQIAIARPTAEAVAAIPTNPMLATEDGSSFTALPAAVRTEMDANSTQIAAIVADTNELQTDDVPGLIAALNDLTAAEVGAYLSSLVPDPAVPATYNADGTVNVLTLTNGTVWTHVYTAGKLTGITVS